MQQVNGMYKDAAGVWHQDRYRPLVAAMVNLILNVAFVRFCGIYAILLSTIISYVFISMPWMISNVFKYVFYRDWKQFVQECIIYFLVACIVTALCRGMCMITKSIPLFGQVVINLAISCLLSNVLLFLAYKKNKYYSQMIALVDKITKFKFTRLLQLLNN